MQESIVETLKNMKSEQNLTLQQISSASGVPLSTVNRILSGQTENPSFRDVAAIVAASLSFGLVATVFVVARIGLIAILILLIFLFVIAGLVRARRTAPLRVIE